MYTIGEFARIGNVSRKTLRYYDEIGLLHPARVDEANRYRYYSDDQVEVILTISELKGLGLRTGAGKDRGRQAGGAGAVRDLHLYRRLFPAGPGLRGGAQMDRRQPLPHRFRSLRLLYEQSPGCQKP
jgi:hypothetical protein